MRVARKALTEIVALAHDIHDPDEIAVRIRGTAHRALGLHIPEPAGEEHRAAR
jgi:hypothetical protein